MERFDHHCPWINNCVGTRNHWAFLIFLVTMECSIVLNFGMIIENIILIDTHGNLQSKKLIYEIFSDDLHKNLRVV